MPFSVAEVCNDPDLAQAVTIYRSKGAFGPDGWQNQTTTIPAYGVLNVAESKSLQQVPEGDRLTGAIEFYSVAPIYTTSEDQSELSDQIMWRGYMYRVQSVQKWVDHGFYSAILVRMQGS